MIKRLKKYWWVILVLIVGALLLVNSRGSLLDIQTAEVSTTNISRTVLSSGKLVVKDGAIYSPSTGTVENVLVGEGSIVKKGQPILQLDAGSLSAGVSQAEAALLQAKQAEKALLDTYLTDAKKEALRVAMDNAGDARTRAQRNYNDDSSDTNKAALEAAINAHELSESNFEAAINSEPNQTSLAAAQASVDAAQVAYNEANRTVGKSLVVAPVDGVISYVRDQVAEVAGSGRTVTMGQLLATVSTPGTLSFQVEVDETTIPLISIGLSTTVELDAFLGQSFKGKVGAISGRPILNSNGSDVYLVQVNVDAADAGFREGMQGQAEFILETANEVMAVPAAAVIVDGDDDIVYVLKSDNTVERRVVEIGVESATESQLISGVKVGEQVVISSNVRDLKNGQSVVVSAE